MAKTGCFKVTLKMSSTDTGIDGDPDSKEYSYIDTDGGGNIYVLAKSLKEVGARFPWAEHIVKVGIGLSLEDK